MTALLSGLPKKSCYGVQMVQKAASRNLTGSNKYDHISPVLILLHWLLIHVRADFKLLLLSYTAVIGIVPSYLKELVPYEPAKSLCFQEIGLQTNDVGAHVFYFHAHLCCICCDVLFFFLVKFCYLFLPALKTTVIWKCYVNIIKNRSNAQVTILCTPHFKAKSFHQFLLHKLKALLIILKKDCYCRQNTANLYLVCLVLTYFHVIV